MARLTRHEAQQVLARHGVDGAFSDADLDTLVAIAAAHGWLSSVEPVGRTRGTTRYHAMVWDPTRGGLHAPTSLAARQQPTTLAAQRHGRTAAEALGLALATMLARQERLAASPSAPTH